MARTSPNGRELAARLRERPLEGSRRERRERRAEVVVLLEGESNGGEFDRRHVSLARHRVKVVVPVGVERHLDRARAAELRADSLKFIIHFVGDLHQPVAPPFFVRTVGRGR